MSKALEALHRELEAAGLKPGTPAFEKEYRSRKVRLCKEKRSVSSCWNCVYFDHCELVKAHLRDLYKVDQQKGGTGGDSTPTRS
jgi:hypothetical protein